MNNNSPLKRLMLKVLAGSVVFAAITGIVIVLRGQWSWFEIRVMLTTIILAVASLCGLACDVSRMPRGKNILPLAGIVLAFITTVLLLLAIWPEFEEEWYLKTVSVFGVFTVATVQVCLLSIARLAKRFSWVYLITIQVVYGLAVYISAMILWELDDDKAFRFLAALSIVAAALSLLIPLLHRISRTDTNHARPLTILEEQNVDSIDQEIDRLQREIAKLQMLREQIAQEAVSESNPE